MRNPELESLRHFVVDFSIVLATRATALVPVSSMGCCLSLGLHQGRGEGGPAAWATACRHITLAQACALERLFKAQIRGENFE